MGVCSVKRDDNVPSYLGPIFSPRLVFRTTLEALMNPSDNPRTSSRISMPPEVQGSHVQKRCLRANPTSHICTPLFSILFSFTAFYVSLSLPLPRSLPYPLFRRTLPLSSYPEYVERVQNEALRAAPGVIINLPRHSRLSHDPAHAPVQLRQAGRSHDLGVEVLAINSCTRASGWVPNERNRRGGGRAYALLASAVRPCTTHARLDRARDATGGRGTHIELDYGYSRNERCFRALLSCGHVSHVLLCR